MRRRRSSSPPRHRHHHQQLPPNKRVEQHHGGEEGRRGGTEEKRKHEDHHQRGHSHAGPAPPPPPPDFKLSGALAADVKTGNVKVGVVCKHAPPTDSALCTKDKWMVFVFNTDGSGGDDETLHLHRKATYLFGRDEKLADVMLNDPTCSKEHAVIQYRRLPDGTVRPYLMDLESTNGTRLNDVLIPSARYIELKDNDVFSFGQGTEYVMKKAPG